MSEVICTFPGKCGDALHQWGVAYWWAKRNEQKFTAWLDEKSCHMLKPLFESQTDVCDGVEFKPGVEGYQCGGQPYHFDLPTSAYDGRRIYHMGLRGFPNRQLTLECMHTSGLQTDVDQQTMAEQPCLHVTPRDHANRLLIHGQGAYKHTKSTPTMWKFLAGIRGELESMFDEIVFVGSEDDREVGTRTYPQWKQFDDAGNFLTLAEYMAGSRCVIGVGSSVVALAGCLKVPSVRVHDPIGQHPKAIWNNLAVNSINDTEIELRKTWPEFKEQWLDPVGEAA